VSVADQLSFKWDEQQQLWTSYWSRAGLAITIAGTESAVNEELHATVSQALDNFKQLMDEVRTFVTGKTIDVQGASDKKVTYPADAPIEFQQIQAIDLAVPNVFVLFFSGYPDPYFLYGVAVRDGKPFEVQCGSF